MKALLTSLLLLCPLATRADELTITIDATKTGEPVSPYIYGQFIEHMGRCIYGGIWAEMLEDRKFYFPITAEYDPYKDLEDTDYPVVGASPWEIFGENARVTMIADPKHVFVGEHVPLLTAGSGIRQHDLGVKEGMSYQGYLWAKPASGKAEIEVSLVFGESQESRASHTFTVAGADYIKSSFTLTSGATLDSGATLEIRSVDGDVYLGPPSLMPADNTGGMRTDTLALLKELDSPIYRWPGGNFVSGYDWRDGIGDRDRRPPRKNPAWTGVEHNDFGTDEFMAFCREVGTEPMIAANTGFGDDYSAAQWVEYCNAGRETIGGSWRVQNGHPEPYGVKHWCVGNEMFGPWQLGFMQMRHYILKHNRFAERMWQVDPGLELVAVGDLTTINDKYDPDQAESGKTCSEIMLEECADHMTYLSEHFYVGRVPWEDEHPEMDTVTLAGAVREAIKAKADGHRELQARLPNLNGRLVPIAMDEWNYWHEEYVYGELGCQYGLQEGLGIAAGLHEFFRNSDLIKMAHYAQTVNVIGAIKTSKTAAQMETTGLALQLYREHFGTIPLDIAADTLPHDIAAALTGDRKFLTVAVVNPTSEALDLRLAFEHVRPTGPATSWHFTGDSPTAHNEPGKEAAIALQSTEGIDLGNAVRVPALACVIYRVAVTR